MVSVSYTSDLFAEGASPYGVPLTFLLSQLDLSAIIADIEKTYYAPCLAHHFHYRPELMLKLWFFKQYHKLTFRNVIESLTDDDLFYLLTAKEWEEYKRHEFRLPSASALHYFMHNRLGEEGLTRIMFQLGKEILHYLNHHPELAKSQNAIIDSTPLEASRYSLYNAYNPYYGILMSKAHIISVEGYPLYCIFSEGTEDDGTYGHRLVHAIKPMNPQFTTCLCDGGYDNFLMYAEIHEELNAVPVIRIRDNYKIHREATRKEIWKLINSLWKEGGDVHDPHQKKLMFLYNLQLEDMKNPDKYKELVGMNLRNKNITYYKEIEEQLKRRGRCEEFHSQIKLVFKFNVKGYQKYSRANYVMLDFITTQAMMLAYLQNGSLNKSLAGFV